MWAMVCIIVSELHDTVLVLIFLQYGLQMPIGLLRADNNLPPWRPGLKEVCMGDFYSCSVYCVISGSFSLYSGRFYYLIFQLIS